ncbi:MAG: Hsp33 family molecular chaperone HslO [Oscillospiraceae bacterium]
MERALISLGAEELKNILAEQGSCQMTCQFCDAVYRFDGPELQQLIDDLEKKK